MQQNIKPLSLDKIVGIPQVLRPHVSNRNLKVWQIPKKGIRYVLGCDVAEGLGGKRDSSTIYVSDKDGVQVAEFNCSLDYNSIKLYLDNMKQFLNDVACMPSVLGSSTNIANISEVSMQILLMMASVYADENKKWLNIGFQKRFEMFKKILGMQGIKVDSDVEVIYNVAMPVASTEMIANLKALQEMGAISKETIMEKTEYVSDVEVEKKRLSGENVNRSPNGEQLKTTDNVDNSVDNLA